MRAHALTVVMVARAMAGTTAGWGSTSETPYII